MENELIPKTSTYAKQFSFVEVGYADLPVEKVEDILHSLGEAWKIAAEWAQGTKYGDSDEADAISLIMSQIRKKYQDRATQEQRSKWA